MTNEEMKVLKFETMFDGLYDKMERTEIYLGKSFDPKSGVNVLLGNKNDNPYLKTIFSKSPTRIYTYTMKMFGKSCPARNVGLEPSVENLILASKDCLKCEYACESCSMPLQTIFFALIALAIDEELYKEQLEAVSDAAYMMGFNEAMIEDWTTVVKKFLMAEEIDSEQLKTEEAKKFFAFFKNN